MRENNKEMAIVRIGNDIGVTWSFFQTQPGVSWKVPFDLTNLDLSLALFNPLTGEVAIHDFTVTDNSLHWVFKGKDQSKLGKYTLTLTVNKGQDNQHVVDRIEFLELVSRSNTGVIRQGCAHGGRSVLDTECIALGTVVDYGYETVAHAMMTYARKEDIEAMMRNAYLAISRKAEGLFKVDYDALDEDYARDYFEHRAPALIAGGCSVVAHGGLVGRNMDWLKHHPDGSVDAVFEVHTSAAQGRYASFGFAGSLAELSVEKVESREYSDAYRLLPYYLQDGENEKGLMAAILVVPATSSRMTVPEVERRDRVCSLALVRYILDHYQSVDEAVNSLRNYVEIFHPASLTAMGYEPHFFLKDSTKSVVLEFSGTGLVAIESNVCTNFHLHGVTFNPDGMVWTNADVLDGHLPSSQGIENYGSGLERFNALVSAAPESKEDMRELLESILFSKAYTLSEGVWYSEFVGGNITVDTPADDQALLARLAEYRQKYADDADDIWITKQSVIYDLANFSASLTVFEGEEEYRAALAEDNDVATKEFVEERVSNFITRSVNDLVNYYLKSETYTKAEVQALISAVQQFTYIVLPVLPAASASTMHKIYLVPSSEPEAQNVKDEFITIDNGTEAETRYTWEQIGSTAIDLSGYYTSQQTDAAISVALTAALANYTTTSALTLLLAGKQDALTPEQLAAVNSGITSSKVEEIAGKYVKPQTGIPATDLSEPVQTTLGKVAGLEQEVSELTPVDNLTSESTTTPLSANQGRVLSERIDGAFQIVTELPETGEVGKTYLVLQSGSTDTYDEWIYVDSTWAKKGARLVDLTGYAKKDGYYSGLGAGTADNLVGRGSVPATFTHRPTAGSASVGSGAATIKALKGNTIVWNQLAKVDVPTRTSRGITLTNKGNGRYSIVGTANSDVSFALSVNGASVHSYLLKGIPTGSSSDGYCVTYLPYDQTSVRITAPVIRPSSGYAMNYHVSIKGGTVISQEVEFTPQIFDLTHMFGAGNEPSTVEEFEALFPLDYYAYNAGELLSFNGTGIKTDGFNQWDEEWEAGGIDTTTGQPKSQVNVIRTKNFIPVFADKTYFLKQPAAYSSTRRLYVYDANKNFLRYEGAPLGVNSTFTLQQGDAYIKFIWDGTTYNHDICINISHSGIRNGEYEPYWTETKQLPALDFFNVTYTGADGQQHVAGGMKSAGTARDEWNGTKKVRRIGVVDLGTLEWSYNGTHNVLNVSLPDDVVLYKLAQSTNLNYVCGLYASVNPINDGGGSTDMPDKTVARRFTGTGSRTIYIKDSAYTDAASFKAAMAGVLLFYELAEPVEADAEPLGNYREDDYGTETLLPENGDEPTTSPIIMDVQYPMNAVDTLRNLPQNYQSQESMDAALTALGTALGFTFTKTWDATNGKWTYAITRTTE